MCEILDTSNCASDSVQLQDYQLQSGKFKIIPLNDGTCNYVVYDMRNSPHFTYVNSSLRAC